MDRERVMRGGIMDIGRRFFMNVFYVVVLFYGRNLWEFVKGRLIV